MRQPKNKREALYVLVNHQRFTETTCQKALEIAWPMLSRSRLADRAKLVDRSWQPDLVAHYWPQREIVLIELKKTGTGFTDQLLDYARRFIEKHQQERFTLKLMAIAVRNKGLVELWHHDQIVVLPWNRLVTVDENRNPKVQPNLIDQVVSTIRPYWKS